MKTIKIKQIGDIITGNTPPRKNKEYFGEDYTWIKPTDITLNRRCVIKTEEKFSQLAYEKYKKSLIPPQSTCVVTIGSIGRKICLTTEYSFTNQAINSVIPDKDKFDPKFVYYLLKYNLPQLIKRNLGTTSGRENISKSDFSNINVNIPDLLTQMKTGKILSEYDDLIENNELKIKLLEEFAQLIFHEWFVQYHFPGHEKFPLVDSRTDLGLVPESWSIKKLKNYINFVKGVEPGSKNYLKENIEESLPFNRVGDFGKRPSKIFVNINLLRNRILDEKDIAMTFDGTPGIVKIGISGGYASGIRKIDIIDEGVTWAYIYHLLNSDNIQNIVKKHSKGTTILHAGSSINSMQFALPPRKIIYEFEDIVSPVLNHILILIKKIRHLQDIRDILMSKLVSGQINVSDMDIKN